MSIQQRLAGAAMVIALVLLYLFVLTKGQLS